MKSEVKRIFKVLSCFLTIAFVLFASVLMPVSAAVPEKIYQFSDIYNSTEIVDGDIVTYYDLDRLGLEPFVSVRRNGTQTDQIYSHMFQLSLTGTDTTVWAEVNPLRGPAGTVQYGKFLLSLQDFAESSYLEFSFRSIVDGGAAKVTGNWSFKGYLVLYFYDSNFDQISRLQSQPIGYFPESEAEQWIFDSELSFILPNQASYVAPQIIYSVDYEGVEENSTFYISLESATFKTSLDSVLANSQTMQRIEDQIGDVSDKLDDIQGSIDDGNEKLDTVIDGTPEMNGQAQDNSQLHDEVDQDLNNAMDDFDNKSDPDNILPDNSYSPEELEAITHDFSTGEAWRLVKQIFGRILADDGITDILMLVIGFINISVLLLGR